MERLRPRQRLDAVFSGFTKAEIEKMEKLLVESGEILLSKEFCKKIARSFSSSANRAGKPIVKWNEVQSWFIARLQESKSNVTSLSDASKNEPRVSKTFPSNSEHQSSQILKEVVCEAVEKVADLTELEFEAKSSTDGAWYDVDMFLSHRFLSSGEAEVLVRFIGFGAEDDEWVNVKNAVRERSIPLEHSECNKLKVGDVLLCLQERSNQAIYYDACLLDIERKMHDIRGCRCLFLVRYDHDCSEERVRLRRLCSIQVQGLCIR